MSAGRIEGLEKLNIFNSLCSIPRALIGWSTFVDLNDNRTVAGRVTDVDGYMNITLEQAVLIDQQRGQQAFDTFHVQARNIRMVHLPERFEPRAQVGQLLEELGGRGRAGRMRADQKGMQRTFKVKRAAGRQQETLRELAEAERRKREEEEREEEQKEQKEQTKE